MQLVPNSTTQKEKLAGRGKKKGAAKPKKKLAGHQLMDQLISKARSMGAVTPLPAGLPGQKTIVKV